MNKEKEKAYIFPGDIDIRLIISKIKATCLKKISIKDYYINKNLRVRSIDDNQFLITKKIGDKSRGERLENEEEISKNTANILIEESKLIIEKMRHILDIKNNSNSNIYLDKIISPLKILILEIEQKDNDQLSNYFCFQNKLKECPLSSYDLFKRKIGICGGPSAGKTTISRELNKKINIELNGNSATSLEYATTFIQKYNQIPTINDQFMIWYQQKKREDDTQNKCDILISDSPSFLSYIYSVYNSMGKNLDKNKIIYLSKIYKRVLEHTGSYSDIIFLETLNYKEDNIRYQNTEQAKEISNMIESFLHIHGIKYIKSNYNNIDTIFKEIFYLNSLEDLDQ